MARLPEPGKDAEVWGNILNDFLLNEHTPSGALKLRTDGTFDQFYKRPGSGIPKTDLAAALQAEIDQAGESDVINIKTYGAVGDGTTDDTSSINSALQAVATANKKTVLIPKGTYLISGNLLVPSNCTITGEGFDSVLQRKPGNNLINVLHIDSKENIRITNLRIDGQKDDIIANYSSEALDGNHIYVACNGIYITGPGDTPSKNITIDHCWLHDAYYGNIEADSADGLTICDNTLFYGRDNQVNIRVHGEGGYCRNLIISGNLVYGKGPISTANQFSGIQCLRSSYITVTGNLCYGFGNTVTNEGDGIGLEGCRFVTIDGNICHHNLNQGIKIDQTIEGTPAPWNEQEAYVPGECVTYGSINYRAKTYNHHVTPPSASHWEVLSGGPYQQKSVNVTVSSNTVTNNNYYAATGGGVLTVGIFAQHSENTLIEGNVVVGNYQGINNGYDTRSLTVRGNTVFNNEHIGIAFWNNADAYGPFIIENNYVTRNGDKGIDTVVPAFITNNAVEKNAQAGISVAITGTVVQTNPVILVENNTLIDNGDSGILVNGGFTSAVPVEVRSNFAPSSTIQPRGLGENGTPIRCTHNRFLTQNVEKWYFSHPASVWIDERTSQIKKVTGDYTVTDDDEVVLVTPASNTTITLQAPDTTHPPAHPGRKVTISKTGALPSGVFVATQGGIINGPTTIADNSAQTFISDGANWNVAS